MVLLTVAQRDEARSVTVSGNGLTGIEVANVDNAQGQGGVSVWPGRAPRPALYDLGAGRRAERLRPRLRALRAPDARRGRRCGSGDSCLFVVGTGGRHLRPFGAAAANSEVRNATRFGVLCLTLHPSGYDWAFVPEGGGAFTESGSASCH